MSRNKTLNEKTLKRINIYDAEIELLDLLLAIELGQVDLIDHNKEIFFAINLIFNKLSIRDSIEFKKIF